MLIRSVAPVVYPVTSYQLPTAKVITFSNGSCLHVLKGNSQPIIKFEIVFNAGKRYETQKGVSYLASKMLLEGSKYYSAKQIADLVAYYGASLECNQGFDRSTLTLYCLSKHFHRLLPVIKDIIAHPVIPETELNLLKKRTVQNIQIEKEKNSYLATKLLTQNIYGENHPYVAGQNESEIEAVTKQDIQFFIDKFYSHGSALYFLSGDVEQHLEDQIQHAFDLPKSFNEIAEATFVKTKAKTTSFLDKPEKLQTSIRIGSSWPLMHHPDYPKLALLNKILGGYFGSRLMKNIREDKGFTYGIFSTLSAKEKDTLFYIGTDVNFQNTEETIQEINKEIIILQEQAISAEELEVVKTYTVGKFVNESTTIFDQSERYKNIILKNLPPDYYSNYIKTLQDTSAENLMMLSQEFLNPASLVYVSVGRK